MLLRLRNTLIQMSIHSKLECVDDNEYVITSPLSIECNDLCIMKEQRRSMFLCLWCSFFVFHPEFAQAAVTLVCDSLVVCPGDDEQRICTCTSDVLLRWTTNRTGVFDGSGISFFPATPVGSSATAMGFVVNLTSNTNGVLTSVMTFTPTAVSSSGIAVTCDDPFSSAAETENLAVTLPGTCRFSS